MEEEKKKIRVNIITGFLGVGKTTTINKILEKKPANERWAIIINEFGAVSIDHTLFQENEGLFVKEVAGGCICCTANLPMQMTLNLVIKQQKPDRILIEPTGIGHPENILDILRGRFMKDILDVRATICLVDPRRWADEKVSSHETFQDQINLADVLIATKTDLADEDLTERFMDWAEELYPPKLAIDTSQNGNLKIELLDIEPYNQRKALFPHAHEHHHEHSHEVEELQEISLNNPYRKESNGLGRFSCGWIFSAEEIFDVNQLKAFFKGLKGIYRAKGVFRTGKDWVLINAVDNEFTIQYIAYRKDSRVELISIETQDWQYYEDKIMSCRISK